MFERGELSQITANAELADRLLATAHQHLASARLLAADAGASLRELMDRMGHSSTRAALIYLHSSDERQRMLADAVGKAARTALGRTGAASGTEVARSPGQVP